MPGPSTFVDSITSKISSAIGLNGSLRKRKTSGFDIEEFKSTISAHGILPTNLFLVTILPRQLGAYNAFYNQTIDSRTLSFFCLQTTLPGIDISVQANRTTGTGATENFPESAIFTDIGLNFIGDGKGHILSFFHNWLNNIVNFSGTNTNKFYRVAYKDTYTCTINITVFDPFSDKIIEYNLHDAFPYRLNQIQMEWGPSTTMMSVNTEFHYTTWNTNSFLINSENSNFGLSNIQKLLKLGTIAETISSIRRPEGIGDAINLINNANIIGGGLKSFF